MCLIVKLKVESEYRTIEKDKLPAASLMAMCQQFVTEKKSLLLASCQPIRFRTCNEPEIEIQTILLTGLKV